jgi:hypothetical protein
MLAMAPLLLAGAVMGTAALLVVAGSAKVYRSRRVPDGDAIQAALRVGPARWRWVVLATGTVEILTGAAVLAGGHPAVAGVAMAAQGAIFSVALGYVRWARIPGKCGCVLPSAEERITWRAGCRAGFVLGAGVVGATVRLDLPPPRTWSGAAVVAVGAGVLFVLVGADQPMRTPVCHRRWWRPMRDTVDGLVRHRIFAAMAAGAGPFDEVFGYRRSGCVEEFWFRPAAPPRPDGTVAFRVTRPGPARTLAVQARTGAEIPARVRRYRTTRPVSQPSGTVAGDGGGGRPA